MPKFQVQLIRTEYKSYETIVEAESEQEADEIVDEMEISDDEWQLGNAEEDRYITQLNDKKSADA